MDKVSLMRKEYSSEYIILDYNLFKTLLFNLGNLLDDLLFDLDGIVELENAKVAEWTIRKESLKELFDKWESIDENIFLSISTFFKIDVDIVKLKVLIILKEWYASSSGDFVYVCWS